MYACETVLPDVLLNDWCPDAGVTEHCFHQEKHLMKIEYQSPILHHIRKYILDMVNPMFVAPDLWFFPQCNRYKDLLAKQTKRFST